MAYIAGSADRVPSAVVKAAKQEQSDVGEVGGDEPKQRTREDWRKAKELEEARKLGKIPALVDEEGRDINPHIPQYIAAAPWYLGFTTPTLKHQRPQEEKKKEFDDLNSWYKRGVKSGSIATKYRKGACENCGALTHTKKTCLERPRKVGAKFTGDEIAPDEHMQPQLSFDYDGKRDRWNGYNPKEHQAVIEEYAKMEEAKKHLKAQQLQEDLKTGKISEKSNREVDSDDDDEKYAESAPMPGTNFDTKRRITVRNLRIREDTAKYLRNLDPNSAYYDPKTRSMRENPYHNTGKSAEELPYAGDNFVRSEGDTTKMATAQLFAWEAYEKGTDVHLQAEPTKLELLHKEFKVRKDDFTEDQKQSILEKYGGEEHLDAPAKELLLAQTEDYVEYSRHGTVIKGQEKAKVKSKYEEDVWINNHTSVWGSYWKNGLWGYKCCHSFVKHSYCTGEAGKEAASSNIGDLLQTVDHPEEPVKSLLEQHQEAQAIKMQEKKKKDKKKKKKHKKSESDSDGSEDEIQKSKERLRKALEKEELLRQEAERILAMDERKRPYNSMQTFNDYREPTEEEMEAFRLKRRREEDPMARFLEK
ncbi:pre-mRNA-splicing factor SLU7-like [Ptychodera flava]|uniref:pre-mRNA-splicing factor SLU7-like n=1 Tax=Ptychodera flava TaxID=63121 RepID=UPI00396A132A